MPPSTTLESVAILEYLDEQYPQVGYGRLFPQHVRHRAIARRLIHETEYLAPPMRELGGELFFKPESEWDLETIAKGREALALELARFQRELRGEYLVCELSASDLTLYLWLALALRMERKKPDLGIASLIGASLSDWMRRIEAFLLRKDHPSALEKRVIAGVQAGLLRAKRSVDRRSTKLATAVPSDRGRRRGAARSP